MKTSEITFSSAQSAKVVLLEGHERGAAAVSLMGLRAVPLTAFVFGAADTLPDSARADLDRLFSDALVPAVAQEGGVLVDGGTASGVMELLGRARVRFAHPPPLVGVTVEGLVAFPHESTEDGDRPPLDPGHSHFVLVRGDAWGDETRTMEDVLRALGEGGSVVGIMAGGGEIAERERQICERRGWPVIVLEGAGGTGDGAAKAMVSTGTPYVFPLSGSVKEFKALLLRLDGPCVHAAHEESLRSQWAAFVEYDRSASGHQRQFFNVFAAILVGGGLATLLAILSGDAGAGLIPLLPIPNPRETLRTATIVVPLIITAFGAYLTIFKPSNKWILLRGAAEAIKREIYRYRTATGPYAPGARADKSREHVLVESVGAIKQSAQQTEANTSAPWTPRRGSARKAPSDPLRFVRLPKGDDGLSSLNGSQYVALRIEDQIGFLRHKCVRLERHRTTIQCVGLTIGIVSSFLAAMGDAPWIALTTAVATALTTYSGVQQYDSTIVKYNQTRVDLETLAAWWKALSTRGRADQANLERIVGLCEATLERELRGWVQHMQEALKDSTASETHPGPHDEGPKDASAPPATSPPETPAPPPNSLIRQRNHVVAPHGADAPK